MSTYLVILFLGVVYFSSGRIHPKLILNKYEYNLVQKVKTGKTIWICTKKNQLKCKARLQSSGKCIRIKAVDHNHPPTHDGIFGNLKSQVVHIEYTSEKFM